MKRKRPASTAQRACKRPKTAKTDPGRPHHPVCPLLHQYYPEVVTLRQYLASRLPKKRRKRLRHYGHDAAQPSDPLLVALLDTTLVGCFKHVHIDDSSLIDEDISVFTQQLATSNASRSLTPGEFKQREIVDFTVWLLFRRHRAKHRPKHLLCQNHQQWLSEGTNGVVAEAVSGIPNVYSIAPNPHIQTLKSHPWNAVPGLLGRDAQKILVDMLVDCGVFCPVANSSNLSQLSGIPMSDLDVLRSPDDRLAEHDDQQGARYTENENVHTRSHQEIRLLRHRMLYARPVLNAKGQVRYGLTHMHVLNRCRDLDDSEQTRHIIKYVFPAQFGLHNVLRSSVDAKDTSARFKDYTSREEEIERKDRIQKQKSNGARQKRSSLPRRLRGELEHLMQRMRKRHSTCSYAALLNHYCPLDTTVDSGRSVQQASNIAQVAAFCKAAVSTVFPKELWGPNTQQVRCNVDHFTRLRRYETMSLHDVLQNMKLSEISWLAPPKVAKAHHLSKSDSAKRRELMAELLYYLFDSYLIPLIRSHFHVTESNHQRNRLFYFRQDIWNAMSEPALTSLKHTMLEECSVAEIDQMLNKRALGVSHIRLLPKEQGMRPIVNLRRRVQKLHFGERVLGKSINSLMTPAFSVLNYQKSADPDLLGSALFSADDIFPRLQLYRQLLQSKGLEHQPLFFAKVDVKGCFDTIPQKRLMQLVNRIIGDDHYQTAKYSRAKLTGGHNRETPGFGAKPSWKFLTRATANNNLFDFRHETETDTLDGRTRTVYIDGVTQRRESRRALLALLEEHIGSNLIKIGKRIYRQKEGIPQGSIVSSLLCSYFYAELEREVLGYVNDGNSVLLRLIDDFLVISTERGVAERFLTTMHAGIPEFGVSTKAEKSCANFDIEIDGQKVVSLADRNEFPYCGNAIHMRTLDLSKDKERRRNTNVADSVTVEFSKLPGQSFYRKILNALKMQMHAMLLSTAYNRIETVFSNVHHSFLEVAQKSHHYIKSLPAAKRPSDALVIKMFGDAVKLACFLMKRRRRTSKDVLPYECCVTESQTKWLACSAFLQAFRRRQTRHVDLIGYLETQMLHIVGGSGDGNPRLRVKKEDLRRLIDAATGAP